MKDRNGDEVSKSEMRVEQARIQAAQHGGELEDYLGPSGGGASFDDGYRHGEAPGRVVNEHIYLDKDREPYLKVERCENKQFPQYHWKRGIPAKKNGHWELGAPDGPKIPYMLPDLIATPLDKPVFICEGEKDTESLIDLGGLKDGFTATCCSEGTRSGVWTSELNQYFAGRERVYIIADNDRAGWGHAQRVALNLVDAVGEVRIIKLPGLDLGGDLSDWIAAGGTKQALLKLADASRPFRKRPIIKVARGEIARIIDDTERALAMAKQPIFKRAFGLVTPVWEEKPASKGKKTKVTVLKPLTVSSLTYMTNKHAAHFTRYDKRDKKDNFVDPPPEVIKGLLERGHWGFPVISGVITAPTLRPDGSILDKPEYDAATQLWYRPDDTLGSLDVPKKPSKKQALVALDKLKELLVEFPFKDLRSNSNVVRSVDRSVALASILTAVLRGGFDVAPMFLFLAHSPGSGKSYLVDLVTHIITGRPCPVFGASKTQEELEKRVDAVILEGSSMVSLDNCTVDLQGDKLCMAVERPSIKVRVLGKSVVPEVEWRGMLFATGNNVRVAGDMTRRTLTANLDAGVEQPESREFRYDPIKRIMDDRSAYIAAAITVARAYIQSSERVSCTPLGSYGEWSRFAREPLIWLGEADPVESTTRARANDPERKAALGLVEQWAKHLGTEKSFRVAEIIKLARERKLRPTIVADESDYDYVRPEFYEVIMSEAAKQNQQEIDPSKLGQWLGRIRGQVHGRWRIEAASESESHGNRWILVSAVSEPRPVTEPKPAQQPSATKAPRKKAKKAGKS